MTHIHQMQHNPRQIGLTLPAVGGTAVDYHWIQ